MRLAWLLAAACACGHPAARPASVVPRVSRTVPRLPPPPVLDLDAPDAAYRAAMAVQLQPAWAQFLEDCRLRLPAEHALNELALVATAELAIDAGGQVSVVALASSGNADFDRAVRQVVADAAPMPKPPRALWSDDDRVHVRWLFARDRRQAGPATAEVIEHALPAEAVVGRLLEADDLTRAAHRLRRDPADALVTTLMTRALHDALATGDGVIRRAAAEAVAEAMVAGLAADVRTLIDVTGDRELRIAAVRALSALGDRQVVPALVDLLRADLRKDRALALVEAQALATLGATSEAVDVVGAELAARPPVNATALQALRFVRSPELDDDVVRWATTGDARTRAAACSALEPIAQSVARPAFAKALRDRDTSVRAACLDVIHDAGLVDRVRELLADRDPLVRMHAVIAYARIAGDSAGGDPIATLATDLDPDVRAAAWTVRTAPPPADVARAISDPAPQVRRVVVAQVTDDAVLQRLAASDEDSDVRTRALVRLVMRRGRASSVDSLLERFASAAPGSIDRVRVALAWHLAR